MATGMLIAYAVCAGLYHRERTGKGQLIDTALFATMLCLQSGILFFGEDPPPFVIHEIAPYIPTYRAYRDSEDNSSPWQRSRSSGGASAGWPTSLISRGPALR